MSNSTTEWARAETAVAESATDLRAMTTHREIRAWADEHKLTEPSQWVKVKAELRKQLNIDYDQLRANTVATDSAAVAAAAADAATVILCIAGDAEVGTFAVCPPTNDHESWYGTFHPDDRTYSEGDDLSAETSAAEKAIFLAGKVRAKLDAPAINLIVRSAHPDLSADDITALAAAKKVAVTVEHDDQNLAIALCRAPGYRTWRDIRLDNLLAGTTATT